MKIIFSLDSIGGISRLTPLLTVLVFLAWILPLGIFVKPSQEKMFCNGKRAMCMCSHLAPTQTQSSAGKAIGNNAAGEQKEDGGSSSVGGYVLIMKQNSQIAKKVLLYSEQNSVLYSFLFVRSIEHVPKA